jgi:hypothetical protein
MLTKITLGKSLPLVLVSLVLLSTTTKTLAQYDPRTLSLSTRVGTSQFYGDLSQSLALVSPASFFKIRGFDIGVGINKQLNRTFSVKADLQFASISDQRKQWYNASFKTNIVQANLVTSFDMMHIFYPEVNVRRQKFFVEPYFGFGMIGFKSNVKQLETQAELRKTDFIFKKVFPSGITFRQDLSMSNSISFDFRMNVVFSDVLDGTQGGIDYAKPITTAINDSAIDKNKTAKDRWSSLSIVFNHKIGNNGRQNARTFRR